MNTEALYYYLKGRRITNTPEGDIIKDTKELENYNSFLLNYYSFCQNEYSDYWIKKYNKYISLCGEQYVINTSKNKNKYDKNNR